MERKKKREKIQKVLKEDSILKTDNIIDKIDTKNTLNEAI